MTPDETLNLFKGYKYRINIEEDLETLVYKSLINTAQYQALKQLVIKHLSLISSNSEEDLYNELESLFHESFNDLYSDFVSKRGIPPNEEGLQKNEKE